MSKVNNWVAAQLKNILRKVVLMREKIFIGFFKNVDSIIVVIIFYVFERIQIKLYLKKMNFVTTIFLLTSVLSPKSPQNKFWYISTNFKEVDFIQTNQTQWNQIRVNLENLLICFSFLVNYSKRKHKLVETQKITILSRQEFFALQFGRFISL